MMSFSADFLSPRRAVSLNRHTGPHPSAGSLAGSSPRSRRLRQTRFFKRAFKRVVEHALLLLLFLLEMTELILPNFPRVQCVTCCGPTPMTGVAGAFPREAQGTPLARTYRRPLITPMASPWSREPTSWWWRYRGPSVAKMLRCRSEAKQAHACRVWVHFDCEPPFS